MEDPSGYGRIVRDAQGGVCAIVDASRKDCTPEQVTIDKCNSGFYCFDKEFLLTALDEVSTQNVQGEYYLTDVLALAYQAGRAIGCLRAEDPLECMGVNSRSQLAEASACLQARINTAHMENGVTIIDPATTWIGPDVKIAQDTEIWPMSFFCSDPRAWEAIAFVGPHSRLVDTVVGNGCTLEETIALESRIDDDVTCGRCRVPICALKRICAFVRRRARTSRSRSPRSGRGRRCRIFPISGMRRLAKTSTSEQARSRATTTARRSGPPPWAIGAFVGSDVMLVAPVSVGSDSLIGAGSVITKDVSAGALGLGRARQTEIEGWNEKKKKSQ